MEFETRIIKKPGRRPSFLAGTIAAAGIALSPSQPVNEGQTPVTFNTQETARTYHLTEDEITRLNTPRINLESVSLKQENSGNENKNEQFRKLLENNQVRLLIGSALVFSLASAANIYRLGGKYEERKLQILRTSGPLFLSASLATMEIGSFTDLDRHTAVSLFTASTFLNAAYNVISTYERESNIKTRALAITTSTALSSVGLVALYAVNRF